MSDSLPHRRSVYTHNIRVQNWYGTITFKVIPENNYLEQLMSAVENDILFALFCARLTLLRCLSSGTFKQCDESDNADRNSYLDAVTAHDDTIYSGLEMRTVRMT